MQGVGTAIGNTYQSKEGFGRAYILEKDNAPAMFAQNAIAMKMSGDKAKADMMLESKKKLLEPDPEYWYKDKIEVQGAIDAAHHEGTMLLAAGIDPFGASREAIAFQKKYKNAERLALQSNYDKEWHKGVQSALTGQNKDKEYTPESVVAVDHYLSLPLDYKANNAILPPNLELKRPDFLYDQYLTASVKDMVTGANSKDVYTDGEIFTVSMSSFNNPDVERAATQLYSRLTGPAREALDSEAASMGMTPGPVYLHFKEMRDRLNNPVETFDWNGFMGSLKAPMRAIESNDPNATRTTSSLRLNDAELRTQVELKMPHARHPSVSYLLSNGFIQPGKDDAETLKNARDYTFRLKKSEVSTSDKSIYSGDKFAGSTYTKKVVDDNALEWLASARVGNADAWDYVKGASSSDPTYKVSGITLDQGGRKVRITESTNPREGQLVEGTRDIPLFGTMSIVEEGFGPATKEATIQYADVVDPATREVIAFGATDEDLLRLYYSAFQGKKELYGRFVNPKGSQVYTGGVGKESMVKPTGQNTSKDRL